MSNLVTLGSCGVIPVDRLLEDVDSIFDSFFSDRRCLTRSLVGSPRVNIEETPEGYIIHMAAPGLSRDDFKIQADYGRLVISVDRNVETESKTKWILREYSSSSFSRSWKIPSTVDVSSIEARYEAGILTIHVPISSKKSKKVEIKVS